MDGMAGRDGTMREGEVQSCYFNPSTEAGFYSEVELLQLPDSPNPQILTIGETGIITSSYIEDTSFPTNQERSINDKSSFIASSFSNHSPAVNLDASKLRIPMIEELRDILLSDINNSTSSTNCERSTDNRTFHNDLIQSRLKGLPDGWVTEIRCSGLGNSTFKVYIDPKSGYEFRSLMDAHRYILTEDICHCVIKPKKRKSLEPQTEGRELPDQHGDWLPAGWVVNIRTQIGGKCHGMKKKSYYNPSTGLRFYSKVKLFKHLDAQKVLIPAIRETSSVNTSCFNNASSPTNHQQSQINNTFNVVLTDFSSKSLPNTWRTEITNSQKDALEFQVPSSIIFERENCGSNRCHFLDNSPDYAKIMADMRESVRSSSLPSQVDNSSCTSSYPSCSVEENAEEIRLVNELSRACLVGASSIQEINLGEECPLNLETVDLSRSVSSMAYDTVNEPQKIMQQFSELVNDECQFEIPVQMPQVHVTAPGLAHSPSLQRQNEDLSSLYGNLANERNFEMSGEVSQSIKHIHELGSTTSMVVEAIKTQYQASKLRSALKCYQMIYSGEEQAHEAKANALCHLQAETASILNQPAQSSFATGSFYPQKDAPFVDLVLPYEHANMPVSTEPTAILDHPAQSDLCTGNFYQKDEAPFTGSFYQQDEVPFIEPALTCELQRNTQSPKEFSSEQAQLGRSDSEQQNFPYAFALDNSWSDPYFDFTFNILTSDALDFDDTDKIIQYFEQLGEQTTSKN